MSTTTENTTDAAENTVGLLGGLGIFGATAASIAASVEEDVIEGGGYTPYFELNPQDNKGEDIAIVRLIPSLIQGNKNIASKVSYKVVSEDGKKFMFDSKKSLGWRDNDCIVADTHTSLKNDAAKLAAFRRVFNYKKPSTVLVQVLEYKTNRALEGRILPLRIYEDVEKLIQKTINPSKEDIELNDVVPHNCFDLLAGKALMLKATLKTIPKTATKEEYTGRSFENSIFVKAAKYKHFKIPQVDEEGQVVTTVASDGETVLTSYNQVSLTDAEVAAYEKQDFSNPELLKKLQTIVGYLSQEDTPKLEDYSYISPNEERVGWVETLVQNILAGKPATLGGEVAPTSGDTPTSDENDTTGNGVVDSVVDNADEASNDDLEDILKQAKEE